MLNNICDAVLQKLYPRYQQKLTQKIKKLATSGNEQLANQRGPMSLAEAEAIATDVRQKLNCRQSDRVFEIGCGTGLLGKAISRDLGVYVGCDLVFDLLQLAKQNIVSKNMYFIQADGLALPVSTGSIDRVLLYSVILYLPPSVLKTILKECKRILKPNGFLLLGDIPDPNKVREYLRKRHSIKSEVLLQLAILVYKPLRMVKTMMVKQGYG